MIDQTILLSNTWKDWLLIREHYPLRFGEYFINQHTENYNNWAIFNEKNPDKAYTELLWEIASGELDGKLVDNSEPILYTTKTNQTGGA
jgi:hypothetical protein